mmetsp:Transcript_12216/g.21619  ORF Transcript_12216/g.21619 Transcript_12216/m.21619 type:complete len:544 (+) Transcript_12216:50-1681(+)
MTGVVVWAIAAGVSWMVVRPVLRWRLRRISGPWPLLVLGHLPQMVAQDITIYLHKLHSKQKYGPVFKVWMGGRPIVCVSDVELARKIMLRQAARPDLSYLVTLVGEHHDMYARNTLSLTGPMWRASRRAFEATVMHPKALAGLEPDILRNVGRLLTWLQVNADSGQPCDVVIPLSAMTMDVTGKVAFGVDMFSLDASLTAEKRKALDKVYTDEPAWWDKYEPGSPEFGTAVVRASREVFKGSHIQNGHAIKPLTALFPAFQGLIDQLANIFPDSGQRADLKARHSVISATKRLLAEERARHEAGVDSASGTSFLSTLVSGSQLLAGETMDEATIVMQAFTMLLAGYETTASALSAALFLLSENPQAQARANSEIDSVLHGKSPTKEDLERLPYCCAVIEESLRLLPPGSVAVREGPKADMDLGDGLIIPKGAEMMLPLYTFQRDPAIWPRAEEFLPERFIQPGNKDVAPSTPHAHMPFGHGARMCVGYKFALLEARLALVAMLQRFSFNPPPPSCPKPVFKTGLVYTSPHMWLSIQARHASSS